MSCEECGGNLRLLGQLGNIIWFRCPCCGHEQGQEANEVLKKCPDIYNQGDICLEV